VVPAEIKEWRDLEFKASTLFMSAASVVRVPDYISRGTRFDFRRYKFF
jgi:hypothetical protein